MQISVIVPALNEEKYIGLTLQSLRNQDFKDFEIIVSDAHSTDNTVKIARKYADKIVICKKRGISIQRNQGAKIAEGEILVFTDADTIHPPDWLSKINNRFRENPQAVAIYGNVYPLTSSRKLLTAYLGAELLKDSLDRIGIPLSYGCNLAVRKDAFKKINGFNEDLETREDSDLTLRLKEVGEVKFVKDIVVWASDRRLKGGKKKLMKYWLDNVKFYATKKAQKYTCFR